MQGSAKTKVPLAPTAAIAMASVRINIPQLPILEYILPNYVHQ